MGKVTSEKDEELALFFEMRRLEKENEANNSLLLQLPNDNNNSEDLTDHILDSNNNQNSPISKSTSSMPLQRKSRVEEFLNSENEKSDYDWLLTPPGTPLLPSVEMGSQKTATSQVEFPTSRPTALRSRPANIQVEPTSRRNIASKNPTLSSESKSFTNGNRRPSSSEEPKTATRRSATPAGRPTLPSTTKPSRSTTPNSRSSLPSSKLVAPPVRSSTPTRSLARSSTPTARPSLPVSKSTSRSATPNHQQSTSSSVPGISAPVARASSASKLRPTSSKSSVPSRGPSPTVKSRPWILSEMPGFSLDAPANLKTSLPERPASASRGRPVAPIVKSSSTVTGTNGRVRQPSCSPSRGRASHSSVTSNGNSYRAMSKSRCSDSDEVSPVVIGTQMVERVVNMRKLAPPKRENDHSAHNYSGGKSSDSSGFGRSLSKKSLDMALRHMDIRRSMQGGSLRPLVTSIPASSMYSIRSGPTKSRTISNSNSPLATSSNASSELSVNNAYVGLDGSDVDGNDVGSEQGNSSSASRQGW
ncbi:flocculation FLO11-like protein [Parasponia andersonii]|uniref:Flocculation FLO11-like protein n=1 Tax=Parasponia andersonii TaxID=3476 RepID=A0A2P5BQU3_PARAD|nr:flocculation FLO11-like protein [Parasponia andersonii]